MQLAGQVAAQFAALPLLVRRRPGEPALFGPHGVRVVRRGRSGPLLALVLEVRAVLALDRLVFRRSVFSAGLLAHPHASLQAVARGWGPGRLTASQPACPMEGDGNVAGLASAASAATPPTAATAREPGSRAPHTAR